MSSFLKILEESFRAVFRFPKLFFPKLCIAGLYGILMLWTVGLFGSAQQLLQNPAGSALILQNAFVLLALLLIVLVADTITNAAYSFMVSEFLEKKRISMLKAFRLALGKFFVVVPAVLSTLAIFLVLALPLILAGSYFLLSGSQGLAILCFFGTVILELFVTIAFYSIYPVSAFERKGFMEVISSSAKISRKNFGLVSKLSLFSLAVSGSSLAVAFFAQGIEGIAAFVLLRVLTAVLATYQIVLNPVFYLGFVRRDGK